MQYFTVIYSDEPHKFYSKINIINIFFCNIYLKQPIHRTPLRCYAIIILLQHRTKEIPIKFDSTNRKYSRHVHKTNQIVYNSQTKQFNIICSPYICWPSAASMLHSFHSGSNKAIQYIFMLITTN